MVKSLHVFRSLQKGDRIVGVQETSREMTVTVPTDCSVVPGFLGKSRSLLDPQCWSNNLTLIVVEVTGKSGRRIFERHRDRQQI